MKVLVTLASLAAALLAGAARAAYVTDFEAPMFNTGPINGQDGWTTPDAVAPTARVLTAAEIESELAGRGINPGQAVHGGSQALLVSGAGGSSATIRQIPDMTSTNPVVLDVWARPLPAGTTASPTGNVFLTMEDAAGTRAAAFRFGPQTIDYGTTVTGIWQSTGMAWDDQTWYRFTLTPDYETKTYTFAINGNDVATDVPFYNAASENLTQVRVFRGNNQAGMILDDLSVTPVPEPAAGLAVLIAGGALLARRRR